jgi:hypothetical protein
MILPATRASRLALRGAKQSRRRTDRPRAIRWIVHAALAWACASRLRERRAMGHGATSTPAPSPCGAQGVGVRQGTGERMWGWRGICGRGNVLPPAQGLHGMPSTPGGLHPGRQAVEVQAVSQALLAPVHSEPALNLVGSSVQALHVNSVFTLPKGGQPRSWVGALLDADHAPLVQQQAVQCVLSGDWVCAPCAQSVASPCTLDNSSQPVLMHPMGDVLPGVGIQRRPRGFKPTTAPKMAGLGMEEAGGWHSQSLQGNCTEQNRASPATPSPIPVPSVLICAAQPQHAPKAPKGALNTDHGVGAVFECNGKPNTSHASDGGSGHGPTCQPGLAHASWNLSPVAALPAPYHRLNALSRLRGGSGTAGLEGSSGRWVVATTGGSPARRGLVGDWRGGQLLRRRGYVGRQRRWSITCHGPTCPPTVAAACRAANAAAASRLSCCTQRRALRPRAAR